MTLSNFSRLLLVLFILLGILGGTACNSYYWQSIQGQLTVFSAQQPIEPLLQNAPESLTPSTQQKLALVLKARAFATAHLRLPDNGSFTSYANLKRPFVVWSVMASPELSLTPKQWCYPIVGCAVYRGYFAEADANAFAAQLAAQGLEVSINGVPAYSTLGWFDDPVFHSVLHWPDTSLVGLIFHELAHAKLYLPGDSTFNESYATAVEIAGVRQWLRQTGETEYLADFEERYRFKQAFIAFVMAYRQQFERIYSSNDKVSQKRQQKAELLTHMQQQYQQFKHQWSDRSRYDTWMQGLNNAKFNTLSTYYQYTDKLLNIKENSTGWRDFHQAAAVLSELSDTERAHALSTP